MTNKEPGIHPGLEILPTHQQKRNFTTLHRLIEQKSYTTGIHNGRLALADALREKSALNRNFPLMVEASLTGDQIMPELSAPYQSCIPPHVLDGHTEPFDLTRIGILPMGNNPYDFLFIRRFASTGNSIIGDSYGRTDAVGLYMVQPRKGGAVTHFAVAEHPQEKGKLRIVYELEDSLKIAMMHDVVLATETMKAA